MKYTPNQDPGRQLDPQSMHSLGYTLVASALGALVTVAAVLAVLYPVTATVVVALAGAGWLTVRTLRRFYRERRRTGRARHVCVPKTGVCLKL